MGATAKKYHRMTTSTYDVHNICNLNCEGCSYFVTDRAEKSEAPDNDAYDAFFAAEAARGVTYPIFSGAEPSLNQTPLRIAARHWRYGAVFTNGIKPIDATLPFRVVVSLWSGRAGTRQLRGADSYDKALRHAAVDRRAIVFFTVSRRSVEDIPEVVADCARLSLPITFNFYSMTTEYIRRLEAGEDNDDPFFRFSTRHDNMALDAGDRRRAADLIEACSQAYPETVLFDRSLGLFMASSGPMHDIEPTTRLATNCAILDASTHRSYNFDLTRDDRKDCSSPDLDCSDCRVLGAALASLISRNAGNGDARRDLREVQRLRELMMRMYYWDWEPAAVGSN